MVSAGELRPCSALLLTFFENTYFNGKCIYIFFFLERLTFVVVWKKTIHHPGRQIPADTFGFVKCMGNCDFD